jgi:hypothetical protein
MGFPLTRDLLHRIYATPAIEVARGHAARTSAAFGTMSFQEFIKG